MRTDRVAFSPAGIPAQGKILSQLIETRLCVTDQRDAQAVVAFAHDSLLQSLPALIDWLKREAGLLQTRELAQRETEPVNRHQRPKQRAGGR